MEHGFMYLYAIIDVYSRCIVGWGLYNTLDASNAIEVLERAIQEHDAPEIINSDQGCQYISKEWLETCETYGIKVSMDGRARCLDNIWIERFWRTIKREYIYLNPEDNVVALRRGIAGFIDYYNNQRSTRESGTKYRPMSMRWLHRKKRYGKIRNNHYFRINIQDAEHHLFGRLC